MSVGLDIEFNAFKRGIEYGNFRFLKQNVSGLIPTGDLLSDFNDIDDDQLKALCIRAGMALAMFGCPENISDMVSLNIGITPDAYKHLLYVTSASTKALLVDGLGLNKIKQDDKNNWFIIYYGYLVYQWIDRRDIYKMIYYSNALFHPHILAAKDRDSINWTLLLSEQTFEAAKMYNFEIATLYKRAKELLKRLHFYGGNSGFYAAFQFYNFLPPSTTYSLIAKTLMLQDKDSVHLSALLISLYCPPLVIEDCIKQFR